MNEKDEAQLGESYGTEVMFAVLGAILEVRGDGTGHGGVIDVDAAVEGIADAISLILVNTGIDRKPSAVREVADVVRKRIISSTKHFEESGLHKKWTDAQTIGPAN